MSVMLDWQIHMDSGILVSSEHLEKHISRVTWGRKAALTAAMGRVLAMVPAACQSRRTMLWSDSRSLTRHVILILLLWLSVGHDWKR